MAEAVCESAQNRENLVERLFRAFAVQVRQIEARVAAHEGDAILEDAKILGGLAKTLETLVALDRKVAADESGHLDHEAVRAELSMRLKRLASARSGTARKTVSDRGKSGGTPPRAASNAAKE